MARTMSEQQVLKKLGIPDFRHMTKDKVVQFSSMLHRMDPEVAQKALDQFPHYRQLAKEMVGIYKDICESIVKSNESSTKSFYDACSSILSTLQHELRDLHINSEERAIINSQMIEVARMIGEKDTENKHFLATIAKGVGSVAAFALVIGGTILGAVKILAGDDNKG